MDDSAGMHESVAQACAIHWRVTHMECTETHCALFLCLSVISHVNEAYHVGASHVTQD